MKLESQVCSLMLAKELKSLNVKQESLWYFTEEEDVMMQKYHDTKLEDVNPDNEEWYSAFTVAELGKQLPYSYFTYFDEDWCTGEFRAFDEIFNIGSGYDTEADARAKLLIHLIKEKIVVL